MSKHPRHTSKHKTGTTEKQYKNPTQNSITSRTSNKMIKTKEKQANIST